MQTLAPDKEPASLAIHPEVRPHAFIIMPFGKGKAQMD